MRAQLEVKESNDRAASAASSVWSHWVQPEDLIQPLFVVPGERVEREISAMPGVFQHSVDKATEAALRAHDAGVPAVLLFGVPTRKDATGSSAFDDDGVVQRAVAAMKRAAADLIVITDVCLCEYTDHGHCGILDGETVVNDETCAVLAREAPGRRKKKGMEAAE